MGHAKAEVVVGAALTGVVEGIALTGGVAEVEQQPPGHLPPRPRRGRGRHLSHEGTSWATGLVKEGGLGIRGRLDG